MLYWDKLKYFNVLDKYSNFKARSVKLSYILSKIKTVELNTKMVQILTQEMFLNLTLFPIENPWKQNLEFCRKCEDEWAETENFNFKWSDN